jgi:hypothetical protein
MQPLFHGCALSISVAPMQLHTCSGSPPAKRPFNQRRPAGALATEVRAVDALATCGRSPRGAMRTPSYVKTANYKPAKRATRPLGADRQHVAQERTPRYMLRTSKRSDGGAILQNSQQQLNDVTTHQQLIDRGDSFFTGAFGRTC